MPHSLSSKKRHRQSLVRRGRNRSAKTAIKTQIRKVREAIAAGTIPEAEAQFRLAAKKLDQSAAAGVIHRNVASRMKSRLSAAIKAAKAKK